MKSFGWSRQQTDHYVVQNCHHFYERTQCTLGGRWSRAAVGFKKCCLRCIAILRRGLKINISRVHFLEGGWEGGRVWGGRVWEGGIGREGLGGR